MNFEDITSCLNDLQLDNKEIEKIIQLIQIDEYEKAKKLLLSKRSDKLDSIHERQDELYRLDYLIKELEKRKGGANGSK